MIIYEKIPEFNQETQCIVQSQPVEKDGNIYYGVKVVDLEVDDNDSYVEGF